MQRLTSIEIDGRNLAVLRAAAIRALMILTLVLAGLTEAAAVLPGVSGESEVAPAVAVPEDLSTDQVGDFVAPLDEQQVRQLLISNLETRAIQNQSGAMTDNVSVIEMLKGNRQSLHAAWTGRCRLHQFHGQLFRECGPDCKQADRGERLDRFDYSSGKPGADRRAGFCDRVFLPDPDSPFSTVLVRNKWGRRQRSMGYPLIISLVDLFGLLIFSVSGYIIAAFVRQEGSIEYRFMMEVFDWIILIRFFALIFRLMFHSWPVGFGMINSTVNVSVLHRCMMLFTIVYICGAGTIGLFAANGFSHEHTVLSLIIHGGLLLNPIVLWFVWTQRYDIDRSLFGNVNEEVCPVNGYRYAARAAIWPTVVTVVLTIFGFFNWMIQLLLNNQKGIEAIAIAWWITLLFPVIDLIVTSLLNKLVSLDIFQHKRFKQRKQRFIFIIRSAIRLLLISVLVLSLMQAWGFDLIAKYRTIGGRDIIHTFVDIGVVVLMGYIIWEGIQLWMERHLPDEPDEGAVEIEGEGGGAAATRTETLLPLFKTTLLIVVFVMVVMSVLYALGIQIGPLLAGAGVIGIAVGFGAQKLVQDIISGVFFLIDDAFRKGEYVEVAGMRGTVEKLSVRSMRLRHHLGAVQTIPYGEIATVRNLSRDWVIMKLEIRLPYDVDIEKVRKIIKKIGQEMMQDEEIGPNMLQPLKSQGVMRVEESALIVRMKFTAKPGEQWVIRRVAYTRVRDALAAVGIEFAHREVKVRLPEELENLQKMDYQRKLKGEGGQTPPKQSKARLPRVLLRLQ